MIRHVVVGADASASSAEALRWTADLARATGAKVTVVHAADLVERYQAHASSEDAFEEDLRAMIDRDWCGPLRDGHVTYEVIVRAVPPADLLLSVAREGADLLVVGRRRTGGPDLGRLGSTSLELASQSLVAVVVLPPTP